MIVNNLHSIMPGMIFRYSTLCNNYIRRYPGKYTGDDHLINDLNTSLLIIARLSTGDSMCDHDELTLLSSNGLIGWIYVSSLLPKYITFIAGDERSSNER